MLERLELKYISYACELHAVGLVINNNFQQTYILMYFDFIAIYKPQL